jgi:hypothetical protein
MPTPGRLMPHAAMGGLTALSVAALVLSLVQARPLGETLVRQAAGNTAGAPSLEVVETVDQVVAGQAHVLEQVEETYQAPDRLAADLGGGREEVVVDGVAYLSDDAGRTWYRSEQPVDLADAVAQLDAPMVLLEHARDVDFSHGEHVFHYRTTVAAIVERLHLSLPAPATGTAAVTATVHGEFLRTVHLRFASAGRDFLLSLDYHRVSHAPAVVAPVASGVVP